MVSDGLGVREIAQIVDEAWGPLHLTLAELSLMLADGADLDVILRNAAAATVQCPSDD